MRYALRLYEYKSILFFLTLLGCLVSNEITCFERDTLDLLPACFRYKVAQEEFDQDKDDEQLMIEIWGVGAMMYKTIIDMSALYFSGILLDTSQLYDRVMFDFGKNLFHVVKLLASYGPKMLQNPHLSWKIKLKKTGYMVSFLVVFLIWSQEIAKHKKRQNNIHADMYDLSSHRSVRLDQRGEDVLTHRLRPSAW